MAIILIAIIFLVTAACLLYMELRVTVGLFRLLVHPGHEPIPPGLASECGIWAVLGPGIFIGIHWVNSACNLARSNTQPLVELLCSPWGAGLGVFALGSAGVWLFFLLCRPARLYASSVVLAPLLVMATICLIYSALGGWSMVREILMVAPPGSALSMNAIVMLDSLCLIPFIFAFVNLLLLTIHVARTQASRHREAAGQIPAEAENAD